MALILLMAQITGPDLLAFETIPNKLEAQACAELLEEENVEIPSWICFSSVDGVNAPSGESFKDYLDVLDKSDKVTAVGINCAPPHFVQSLIQRFKKELEKKRKERALEVYEKKKQLTKLRVKAEKLAEEKFGSQLDIIAPVKY